MNIRRIELTNYGSWESLDLPIEPGVTLISGSNGAGKSTILSAAEFALFGATSDAGRLIRRGTDEAVVRVYLEDGLVIKRAVRRSGTTAKVALSVRRFLDEEDYDDLTAATVTETQAVIDGILGVTRETLRASALSMQGDGAAFCEAKPADRKRVLMAALPSMEIWPLLHEQAKAEKRAADDAANVARAEVERLDGARERSLTATVAMGAAGARLAHASAAEEQASATSARLAEEAEAAREARRQHAAAVEAEARARADHERAGVERTAADEALARAKAAAANAPSVEAAQGALTAALGEVDLAEARYRGDMAALGTWGEQIREARQSVRTNTIQRDGAVLRHDAMKARLASATDADRCPECGAPPAAWQEDVASNLARQVHDADIERTTAQEAIDTSQARIALLEEEEPEAVDETPLRLAQRDVAQARTKLAEAQTIQSLAGSIDAAQQRARDAFDRQNETAAQLREATEGVTLTASFTQMRSYVEAENFHGLALTALMEARAAHSAAAAELARAEEAAKLAERQAAEETAARERLEAATREAAKLDWLTKGFGPAGVPAMVIDSTLGDLADEANRVLAELASPIRVDLRSQRVTQKGDLVDALEIVVSMNAMEASYETLSGGERTRVALALRAALTRLLASKRGARVRLLVVDEPAGLDSSACEALAGVLNEFVAAGVFASVILVTHQSELSDLIANVVRVEKGADGCSRLVGAQSQIEQVAS